MSSQKAHSQRTLGRRITNSLTLLVVAVSLIASSSVLLAPIKIHALAGSNFNPGDIISGAVFTNTNSMSVADIQNFLNAQLPTCDTNGSQSVTYNFPFATSTTPAGPLKTATRAQKGIDYDSQFNTSTGAAPYVCLKSYVENPANGENNLQNPTLSIPGGISAALIIYNAAQQYQINPEVLLTTLQKEQGLITDSWPWVGEYKEATGFNCSDTSGCSGYAGFYQQVNAAARQFRNYLNNPNNYNYIVGNNTIDYNVPSVCASSSTVFIQNQATAALYDYTPYQPDTAVLSSTNPTGSASGPGSAVNDNCAAYGNRNFWWYFTTWFGSTQTTIPYAWNPVSQTSYIDSAMSEPETAGVVVDVAPGAKAYLQIQGRNNGNQTWQQANLHLGTSDPDDRASSFADSSWLSPERVQMMQSYVAPGDVGTFDFSITAPQTPGIYREYFDLVDDGVTWLNDPGMYYTINVSSVSTVIRSTNTELASGQTMTPNQYLLSRDGSTAFRFNSSGPLELRSNGDLTWSSGSPPAGTPQVLAMQSDGNLVEYTQSGVVLWSSGTSGNPGAFLAVQPDGNLVIYSSSGSALWSSGTSNIPSYPAIPFYVFPSGVLLPGQSMDTPLGTYHLELQRDGNLVLYKVGVPLWASGTAGMNISNLSMQPDGNLVLYNTAGQAVWNSGTAGHPGSFLAVQADGNLVLYNASGGSTWNTGT